MPAHGSCTQRKSGCSRTARARPSLSRGCAHTSASASSRGTTVPPPRTTASVNQPGDPSGCTAMRADTALDSRRLHDRGPTLDNRRTRADGAGTMEEGAAAQPPSKGPQMTLTVGVPGEVKNSEHRVAITPDGVRELCE